jgi:NAD-dependent SIR2 family protein deacetylase
MKPQKIVFILGAGFSVDAGGPKQNEILGGILESNSSAELKNFITSVFGHNTDIPLEDVYTSLDRAIIRNESLRQYPVDELLLLRDKFEIEVAKYFAKLLNRHDINKTYIDRFAQILIKWRVEAEQTKKDKIAVISTNWDLLLDNSLGSEMQTNRQLCWQNEKRQVWIDYCVMDKQMSDDVEIPSSLTIKARGLTNFKLLKIHGSLNWLKCPNCDSLFVEFGTKLASNIESGSYKCRLCTDDPKKFSRLKPFLASPTFMKDLSNVHYKSIWWNAGFELNEATHIVFVGYSFPFADYEFRNLLARHVDSKTKIKIVTYCEDEREFQDICKRYIDFFGRRVNQNDVSNIRAMDYFLTLPENYQLYIRSLGTLDQRIPAQSNADELIRFRKGTGPTTKIGYMNKNHQMCYGTLGVRGTDHLQYAFQVECQLCGFVYGANGTDIADRLCPECQGGRPGIRYWK